MEERNGKLFSGKRVLVTGGTGSFGHQIVDRLLDEDPLEIRIFSRDEDKQVRMSEEYGMGHQYPRKRALNFVIGDVRNRESVRQAVRGIDIIFHAAALKQVPLCEYHVWEAVQTNVLGAQNVIQAALEENVERVIAVSTDKAVKPVNAMGMTKSIQEKLFTAANFHKSGKRSVFSCVRYGNVVGSRGSVIPLFNRQIEGGGPITITDPRMTRFILTLAEAIELVFHAATQSIGGETFVLKIPAALVTDVAEVMAGSLAPGKHVPVNVVGIRPGEKIHEVLVSEAEAVRTIEDGSTFVILPQIDLEETRSGYLEDSRVTFSEYSSDIARRLTQEEIRGILERTGWLAS
ncbi:MAG: SDR family NAD(P)-dependent oxidoreductase [Deltaproteobacteria bacterium]|nr:SDR family NAD(P)-dependent oxidoreductase [Deltaproteobacteria bacterium]MBI2532809.1 SDR family NAD(P)-dependent oxidoreductase [Deltaproteobacteria bacterium]